MWPCTGGSTCHLSRDLNFTAPMHTGKASSSRNCSQHHTHLGPFTLRSSGKIRGGFQGQKENRWLSAIFSMCPTPGQLTQPSDFLCNHIRILEPWKLLGLSWALPDFLRPSYPLKGGLVGFPVLPLPHTEAIILFPKGAGMTVFRDSHPHSQSHEPRP